VSADATIVDNDRELTVRATAHDGTLLVEPADLTRVTGWALQPEGLCRDNVCVPLRDHAIVVDDAIDVRAFGAVLGRPVAVEPDAGLAVLGEAPAPLGTRLAALEAPPFTLPDLDGHPVSLDDYAGRKRLLIAWASW
jgi:hypothetical protein